MSRSASVSLGWAAVKASTTRRIRGRAGDRATGIPGPQAPSEDSVPVRRADQRLRYRGVNAQALVNDLGHGEIDRQAGERVGLVRAEAPHHLEEVQCPAGGRA